MRFTNIFSNKITYLFPVLILFLTSCGGLKIDNNLPYQLKYLDEYVIPKDFGMDSVWVGGLSDLDYDGKYFYTVNDIPREPVIYKMDIVIENDKIDTIQFMESIKVKHKTEETKQLVFDSEGLNYNPESKTFTLSSEGSINNKKDPFIAEIDQQGNVLDYFSIPEYFQASNEKGLRNNGAFEGLSRSVDNHGFWMATELPMISDGPASKIYRTTSPVRFTYFNKETKTAEKQFAYTLGRLRKLPLLPFGINGVSGILEIEPNQFLVIERGFSAGHSNRGNRIMLYLANGENATDILEESSLKGKMGKSVIPAKKELIYDFNSIRKQLSHKFADNIEGIAFGPKLSNGNQSIVLISDNNFNAFNEQINQVILMELVVNRRR